MAPTDVEPAYLRFIEDLARRFGVDPATLPLEIAPDDEMFVNGVLPGYPNRPGAAFLRFFESALRTHDVYRQLVDHIGGFEGLNRVLDFGSGHGRLTRTLLGCLPRDKIWACDIYPNAVAWQAETFGVNGIVSVSHPDKLALTSGYDVVFSASVFSHLPDPLFRAWMAKLYGLVSPRGLLAFSVHGAGFAPVGVQVGTAGFAYVRQSESDTLDPDIYGMSYVTEDYVRGVIADMCGQRAADDLRAFPRALFESQDLYVVSGPEADLVGLEVRARPVGSFRRLEAGSPVWRGWGIDPNPGEQIVRADLHINDTLVARGRPSAGANDVIRFFPGAPNAPVEWEFDARATSNDALLRVALTSSSGRQGHCYALPATADQPEPPRG